MKCLSATIVAVAAIAVAGCSTGGSTGTGGATPAAAAGSNSRAACAARFNAWENGPAKTAGQQFASAMGKVDAAANASDLPKLDAALKAVGTLAQQLEAYPMPKCADPAGYWPKVLADLKAAGDNAGSSSGLAGLLTVTGPLSKMAGVMTNLSAEVAKNTGNSGGSVLGGG